MINSLSMSTLQTIDFIKNTPFLADVQKEFWLEAFLEELPLSVRKSQSLS